MFTLTEELQDIARTARDFADEHLAPNAVEWDVSHHFPVDTLRKAAQLGMGGITVREDAGGSGLSRLAGVLVFEALSTGCPAVASYLSIHNMVATLIDTFGDARQRDRFLPQLCSMQSLSSYGLTEPGCGSDAAALRTTAVHDGDTYVLNGVKQFISGAGTSDIYLVMARTGGPGPSGISALLVEDGTPGLSFGPNERKMGWHAQPTRQVVLNDVRVPAANLLGGEGSGFRIAMAGLNSGRLNIGACSLGGGAAALERTIAYLREREAFGKPLIESQALQFRLADLATELEAARALLWRAAAALDAGDGNAVTLCAMSKRMATDAGFAAADGAIQLHGGYGYLTEYGIEKIARDLRAHQIIEGTNEIMRLIVARCLVAA
ncbi:acyl-CoA dehydrogenase family protein [Streptomyces sp. CA-181903]|uniref:acyl-CoA dehydrogenase family protein n=1 Tax=Streptomyces sp. CA-181903 TaxID=3240055 RepID=UPI003D8A66D0